MTAWGRSCCSKGYGTNYCIHRTHLFHLTVEKEYIIHCIMMDIVKFKCSIGAGIYYLYLVPNLILCNIWIKTINKILNSICFSKLSLILKELKSFLRLVYFEDIFVIINLLKHILFLCL